MSSCSIIGFYKSTTFIILSNFYRYYNHYIFLQYMLFFLDRNGGNLHMKKFLSLAIIVCISFLNLSVPVNADESSDNEIMSNIQMLNLEEDELINAFTFYSEQDSKSYLVKTYNDHVDVYDDENGIIFNSMTISSLTSEIDFNNIDLFSDTVLRSGPDDYEQWGNWAYYRRDDMHIGDMAGWTISTLAGALKGVFGDFISPLIGLATVIYNKRYENVYANIYISTNVYCTILVKEKYNFYDNSTNAFIKTEEKAPSWWSSPYDYSQPAACRVLAERY